MNFEITDLPVMLMTLTMTGLRALVAFSLLPMFTASLVPATVRAGAALAVVLPVVAGQFQVAPAIEFQALPLMLLIMREAGIGLVIGLGFGALGAGLQIAGDIIDHQTGLTFTQNIDPTFGNSVSITALFLERVLFAVLLSAGFLLIVADALYLSYEIWPIGQPLPTFERVIPFTLIAQSGRLFALGLLLAGPVLLALFVVDIGFGMLNRAAPQLGVFQLGLAMKPIVGLVVLGLALPMVIEQALRALLDLAQTVKALILMGG
jgi:type III secretion protein T